MWSFLLFFSHIVGAFFRALGHPIWRRILLIGCGTIVGLVILASLIGGLTQWVSTDPSSGWILGSIGLAVVIGLLIWAFARHPQWLQSIRRPFQRSTPTRSPGSSPGPSGRWSDGSSSALPPPPVDFTITILPETGSGDTSGFVDGGSGSSRADDDLFDRIKLTREE